MAKIIDPDGLTQATEVVINTTAKTIQLLVAGNLDNDSPGSTSGVTLQALYSFLKEEWKTDTNLNKFKFPIKMYTKTDGTFINSWTFADATSRSLVRDAGWTEGSSIYAGIVSLGNFDDDLDQAYYVQVIGYDSTTEDFDKTGNLNEAIEITGLTDYLKMFLRIEAKLYAEYNLLTEQSIALLEPVLYKLPLANSTDLKVTVDDATIDGSTPYTNMKINYLAGVGFSTLADGAYPANSVVQDSTGRWFFTALGGTSNGGGATAGDTGITDWAAYDGEVQIGTNYYAFNRIIDGATGTDREIYDWAERQLRVLTDINADDSTTANQRSGLTMYGNLAELLVEYVGDTLKTKAGVLITNFNSNSTNNIIFRDIAVDGGGVDEDTYIPLTTTEVWYPYVATGNLVFSSNLDAETDSDTIYAMYFANAGGNLFDSANAIIVRKNPYPTGDYITGEITDTTIPWTFDYDNNEQGGRTKGTDAAVVVVAQGLGGATWTFTEYTITRSAGQTITITADDERNYTNPA